MARSGWERISGHPRGANSPDRADLRFGPGAVRLSGVKTRISRMHLPVPTVFAPRFGRRAAACLLSAALAVAAGCAAPWAAEERPGRAEALVGDDAEPFRGGSGGAGERARLSGPEQRQVLAGMRQAIPPDWEASPAPVVRGVRWPEGVVRAVARAGAARGVELVVIAVREERGSEERSLHLTLRGIRGEPAWIDVVTVADETIVVDHAAMEVTAGYDRMPGAPAAQRLVALVEAALREESKRASLVPRSGE